MSWWAWQNTGPRRGAVARRWARQSLTDLGHPEPRLSPPEAPDPGPILSLPEKKQLLIRVTTCRVSSGFLQNSGGGEYIPGPVGTGGGVSRRWHSAAAQPGEGMAGGGPVGTCYYAFVTAATMWRPTTGDGGCPCMVCWSAAAGRAPDRGDQDLNCAKPPVAGEAAACVPPGERCRRCGMKPCPRCGRRVQPSRTEQHQKQLVCHNLWGDFSRRGSQQKKRRGRPEPEGSTGHSPPRSRAHTDPGSSAAGSEDNRDPQDDIGIMADSPVQVAAVAQPGGARAAPIIGADAMVDSARPAGEAGGVPVDMARFTRFAAAGMDQRHIELVLSLLHHPEFDLASWRSNFTKVQDFKRNLQVETCGVKKVVLVEKSAAPWLHKALGGAQAFEYWRVQSPLREVQDLLNEFRDMALPRSPGGSRALVQEDGVHGPSVGGTWFQEQEGQLSMQMRSAQAATGVTCAGLILAQDDTHINQKGDSLCPCTVSLVNIPDEHRVQARAWRRVAFVPRVEAVCSANDLQALSPQDKARARRELSQLFMSDILEELLRASTESFEAGGRRWVVRFAYATLDMKEAWSVSAVKVTHCVSCYQLSDKVTGEQEQRGGSRTDAEARALCHEVLGPDAKGTEESSPCQCCGVLFRTSAHKERLSSQPAACGRAGYSVTEKLTLERFPGTNLFEFCGAPDGLHVVSGRG